MRYRYPVEERTNNNGGPKASVVETNILDRTTASSVLWSKERYGARSV